MQKKIALISNSFPPCYGGGIGAANYNLYRILKEKGFNVKVYTYRENYLNLKKHKNEPDVYRFCATRFEMRKNNLKRFILSKIDRWILGRKTESNQLSFQYNIVETCNLGSKKINPFLIKFKPDVVIIPDFGAPGLSIKKVKNATHILISHHNPYRMINNPLFVTHSIKDAEKALEAEQKSLNKIDKVICVSNYTKELFIKTHQFEGPITFLPNIIDEKYIISIKKTNIHTLMGISDEVPVIYIPSGGEPVKGERFVVEIIRRLNNLLKGKVGFYISGGINEQQKFEISQLKDKFNIFTPGELTNEISLSYIKDCILCVSPTHTENYAMALVEAIFIGLPCVVFDVGGNNDIVIDGETGFIVSYCDMESLIQKSYRILSSNDVRSKLARGIDKFKTENRASIIAEKYIDFIMFK